MPEQLSLATVAEDLRERLARILYSEPADIDGGKEFRDLGLDSVLAMELIAAVNSSYRLQEKLEVVFQHPTPDRLAAHIAERAATAGSPQP